MTLGIRIAVSMGLLAAAFAAAADERKAPRVPSAEQICAGEQGRAAGLVSVLCAERNGIVQVAELCADVDEYAPQIFANALERWDEQHAATLAAIEGADAALRTSDPAGDAWPTAAPAEPMPIELFDPERIRRDFAARPPAQRRDVCAAAYFAIDRGSIEKPQRHPLAVAQWLEIVPPIERGERVVWAYSANYSDLLWQVERDGDEVFGSAGSRAAFAQRELAAIPFDPVTAAGERGADAAIEVADGWLVSYNMGEFGAALWWFDATGARSTKVSVDHIVDFVRVGERTLAIEGLGHMSLSEGTLIELLPGDDGWEVHKLADLPSAPQAVAVGRDGTLWIAFGDGVRAWRDGALAAPSAALPGGGMVYPVSAVLSADETILYVGMNQYVAEIVLADGRVRMLVPERRLLHELPADVATSMRRAHAPRPAAPPRPPCPEPTTPAPCPGRR